MGPTRFSVLLALAGHIDRDEFARSGRFVAAAFRDELMIDTGLSFGGVAKALADLVTDHDVERLSTGGNAHRSAYILIVPKRPGQNDMRAPTGPESARPQDQKERAHRTGKRAPTGPVLPGTGIRSSRRALERDPVLPGTGMRSSGRALGGASADRDDAMHAAYACMHRDGEDDAAALPDRFVRRIGVTDLSARARFLQLAPHWTERDWRCAWAEVRGRTNVRNPLGLLWKIARGGEVPKREPWVFPEEKSVDVNRRQEKAEKRMAEEEIERTQSMLAERELQQSIGRLSTRQIDQLTADALAKIPEDSGLRKLAAEKGWEKSTTLRAVMGTLLRGGWANDHGPTTKGAP